MSTSLTPTQRFWRKVQITDGCWLYRGGVAINGYGHFSFTPTPGTYKTVLAHRYSYEALVGQIATGLQVDHICHTQDCVAPCSHRLCVRPSHLAQATPRANTLRGKTVSAINAAKTHCRQGHAFDENNTWVNGSERVCLTCKRNRNRLWMRNYKGLPNV